MLTKKIENVLEYCKQHSNHIANYNEEEAKDIVGEVGLWIAENLETFRDIEYYKSFFYKFMKFQILKKAKNHVLKNKKHDDVSTYFKDNEGSAVPNILTSYSDAEHKTDLKLLYTLIEDPKLYGKYIKSNNKGISHLVYKDWLEGYTTEEIMNIHNISRPSVSTNIKKAKSIINKYFDEEIYREGRIYRHGIKR